MTNLRNLDLESLNERITKQRKKFKRTLVGKLINLVVKKYKKGA